MLIFLHCIETTLFIFNCVEDTFLFLRLQTIHRASIDATEEKCPESECMRPYHKERTDLDFILDMVKETCLDRDDEKPQVTEESEWESSHTAGDSVTDEEILLVSMTNTSVAIVNARGCNGPNPCSCCGRSGCTLNDYVVATGQCAVTGES